MASHDDETPEMRRGYHSMGCALCEFPVTIETALAAREMNDPVILGAPNVVRGQSQTSRRVSAREAIAERACDVLTSDYYYPAPLQSTFELAREGILPFPEAWRLVSANPARAVGLADRGAIAPEKRADLILVDDSDPALPSVVGVLVKGKPVLACGGLLPVANGCRAAAARPRNVNRPSLD